MPIKTLAAPPAPKRSPPERAPAHAPAPKPPEKKAAPLAEMLVAPSILFRSPSPCACGGGCPSCSEEAHGSTAIAIGDVDDPFEHEAERMADAIAARPVEMAVPVPVAPVAPPIAEAPAVAAPPAPAVQRTAALIDEVEPQQVLLSAQDGAFAPPIAPPGAPDDPPVAPPSVHHVLASPGAPLGRALRADMERNFGVDFGAVRVHTDGRAGESARDVNALAYTVGPHIVFGHGAYAPESAGGRKLLAHELTHVVQQGAAGGTVARSPARVQRDDAAGPSSPAAASTPIERKIADLQGQIASSTDPLYSAYLARAQLLLGRTQGQPASDADLEAFVAQCLLVATSEPDTLAQLGGSALLNVFAFPETWARRVAGLLDLGVDIVPLRERAVRDQQHVTEVAATVPAEILAHGLPVPYAEIRELRHFELLVKHVRSPGVVGEFARAVRSQLGSVWVVTFYTAWSGMTDRLVTSIATGKFQPDPVAVLQFEQARREGVRTLVARINAVQLDSALTSIDTEIVDIRAATLLQGIGAALAGVATMVGFWDRGKELFARELAIADREIAASSVENLYYAFKWAYDNGYFAGAGEELQRSLRAGMWDMIKEIGVIIALQFVPIVDVALDVYLFAKLGIDVISLVLRLGIAFGRVMQARSVLELQRRAAEMVAEIESGGLMIAIIVATWGIARGVRALRARSARLRAENPELSESDANRRALDEGTPNTREVQLAKRVDQFLKVHGNSNTARRALGIARGVIEDAEQVVKAITGDATADLAVVDRLILEGAAADQRAALRALLRDVGKDIRVRQRFLGETTDYLDIIQAQGARYVEMIVRGRGYPFGFNSLARFTQFKSTVRAALRDFDLPNQDVRVHGSSVASKVRPPDIDVAVIVSDAEFAEIAARVRAGIGKQRVMEQFESGLARGKIANFLFPRIEGEQTFGQRIYGSSDAGSIDLSIIRAGSEFDVGPYLNF